MENLKEQLITSFVSGIGKTTGGLIIAGVFVQLWYLWNSPPTTYYIKSKSSQTEQGNIDNKDDNNDDVYKKIFDEL